jgi:hypothetical protein
MVVPGNATGSSTRAHPARGRPTWWVVLAVSLALMALVAATAARTDGPGGARHGKASVDPRRSAAALSHRKHPGSSHSTSTTDVVPGTVPARSSTPSVGVDAASPPAGHAVVTTTTTTSAPAATTTTTSVASDDTVDPGYLQPPVQRSANFGFTGHGSAQITVTWSNSTYLTLSVSCPSGNQQAGGSSALSLSIPDAEGSCQGTLSEPTDEDSTLSYTITIDPGSGG